MSKVFGELPRSGNVPVYPSGEQEKTSGIMVSRRGVVLGTVGLVSAGLFGGRQLFGGQEVPNASTGGQGENQNNSGIGAEPPTIEADLAPTEILQRSVDDLTERVGMWDGQTSPEELRIAYEAAQMSGNPEAFTAQYYVKKKDVLDASGEINFDKAFEKMVEALDELTNIGDKEDMRDFINDLTPDEYVKYMKKTYGVEITRAISGLKRSITTDEKIMENDLYDEICGAMETIWRIRFETAQQEGSLSIKTEVIYMGHDPVEPVNSRRSDRESYDVDMSLKVAVMDMTNEDPTTIVEFPGTMPWTVHDLKKEDTLVFSRHHDLYPSESMAPLRQLARYQD